MNVSVRISGGFLGNIDIDLDEPHGRFDLDDQRRAIDHLLTEAVRKARLFYEIESTK